MHIWTWVDASWSANSGRWRRRRRRIVPLFFSFFFREKARESGVCNLKVRGLVDVEHTKEGKADLLKSET
jgi:hypothetical protein